MAEDLARIRVRAVDETKDAFNSIKRSVTDLDGAFGRLKGMLAGLGVGVSAGGFALLVKSAISAQSALDDLSEKTSLTVETLSSLQQLAHVSGQDLNEISAMASRFARSVAEAAGGNKELLASFQALGISQEQLRSRKFDELYVEFAGKIAKATNQTYAIAYATQLAGKSAANAMPFFHDLAEEGLKAARVSQEQAAAAERLEKEWRRLTDAWEGSKNELATGLVPWMTRLVEQMREAMRLGGGIRGLWEFGGQISDPTRSPAAALANIQKTITDFEGQRAEALARGDRERVADMDRVIAAHRRQLEMAKFVQRQEAMEGIAGMRGRLDPRDLGPRAGFNLPPPPQTLIASDIVSKQLAEADEEWAKTMREAAQAADDLNVKMRERERWENMFPEHITTGKTNEELREFHKNLLAGIDSLNEIEEINMRLNAGFDEHGNAIKHNTELAEQFGLVFSSAASDAFRNWQGVGNLLKSILVDMAQVWFQQAVSRPLGAMVAKAFAGAFTGGAGSGFGEDIAMQHGGDFTVGGSGGIDSQHVRFWATPGERVTVTPPGQAGAGTVFNVDMRGASLEAVARLEAFVQRMDATLERRAVTATFDAQMRGARP